MTASKNDWKEVKEKIRAEFSKLSESEIDKLNGHMDQLPVIVQKVYQYDKEKAEEQCKNFTDMLNK